MSKRTSSKAVRCIQTMSQAFMFISCCHNITSSEECQDGDYFQFKIISKDTGKDLFDRNDPTYSIDALKFFTVVNNKRIEAMVRDGYSSLGVTIDHQFEMGIIEIKDISKDTVYFTLKNKQDKCCGRVTKIEKVKINQQDIDYRDNPLVEIEITE